MHHKKVYYTLSMIENEKQEHLKSLIQSAKDGNQNAFEEVYTTYYTPLFRYILARTKDKKEAEDLVQTVFMKIWNSLSGWDSSHTSPLAFFFTVARNTLIDHFRKNKHAVIVSNEVVEMFTDKEYISEGEGTVKDEYSALFRAIDTLSKEQQEIITLIYTNDLSYTEIAAITGKREDALRQIHSRAIKKLRKLYEESLHTHD